jgi:putative glycosyltransferase (TIGR04372 family)
LIHLILNLLNRYKKFKYFFLSPFPYAIGTASEQILIASNFAKFLKKKLIIIKIRSLDYKICNNSLFDDLEINKRSLKLIKPLNYMLTTILEIEFIIWRVFIFLNDKILKLKLHEYFRFSIIGVPNIFETNKTKNKDISLKKYEDIEKFNLENQSLSLKAYSEKKCKKILSQFIVERRNKVVCLHVRDGFYRSDFKRKSYRNSNIEKYNRAIKYLIAKGYFVVRLGDKNSKKSKIKNQYFLDYPFSKFKSEAMDLYLIKTSKFYIGTQSGILDVAYLFNKPILTTNMCELFSSYPRKRYDRGIFKKVFLKKNKKQVSILNFMSKSYKHHNPDNENENFYFKENTENEIYLAVKEFEKNLKNKFKNKKSGIQKKFDKIHNNRYKNIFYEREDFQDSLINSVDSIKMIRMFKASSGTLCNSYLKNNL